MFQKRHYIVIGAIILVGLLVVVLRDLHVSDNTLRLLDESSKTFKDMQTERIADLQKQLTIAKQEELETGCVQKDEQGQVKYCGPSKERISRLERQLADEIEKSHHPDATRLSAVTTLIRELQNDPTLQLTFETRTRSPYAEGPSQVETYRDNKGVVYEIDLYSIQIVQFGPGPNSDIGYHTSPKLSTEQLRQRAEDFASKYVSNFDKIRTTFNLTETTKTDQSLTVSFFRWDAKEIPTGDQQKPFVQLGLSPAGDIVSFTNTVLYHNLP